ncbi:rhodanese-like domain-containing protein [Kocuria rhizophila]|uniref:Rhodanese-like domain-containing protein n=2 Tax=Kocuria rhizophila TaxID=72000 RepID=A0AAX2S9K8_KOCRH|nr:MULTISPECIES: rhodanese-like domain-containing protein [Kocuria]MXN62824.1 rhodanese-like domain-containing protein [Bacillus sp. BGMRC0062]WIW67897.1 rhodanese-like domain-containing protein [Kocuria sp. ChxB]KIC69838.1 sulfurtransferase [Kocuria rhizophila]KMK73979.1 sulfurtransferase [Kocuria rhizophila]KUP28609.1 sulfurtransferase [Kocuria rhizophila]
MDNVNNLPSATVDEIPAGAPVLDVREQNEWDAGHIEGAQHLPLSELAERSEEVPLDQDVYVICRSGGRSLRATAYLAQYGYDPVNVLGGMGAWADAGKPIVSETGEAARVL